MTADKRADILSLARKTIHTEALALKHLEQTLGDDFVCAVELILHSRGKLVVTGMGKSGLIGRKIAATLASTGTPSFFLHPGEAFHGDLGMISPEDTVLALSYSGETDEILKIVPFIHTNGNKLISMTAIPNRRWPAIRTCTSTWPCATRPASCTWRLPLRLRHRLPWATRWP